MTERVRDENYAFWHTAQFSNDAGKVVFQDELGGGSSATCVPGTPQYRGANAIFALEGGQLDLQSYYKQPRRQSTTENCVGHEGNLLAFDGKDVMVQAWYQGGASVIDFSNAAKAKEVGHFDRGPISDASLVLGGYWAVYYHNGYLYGSEIERGFDVLKLTGDQFADVNRQRQDVRNPATQQPITFPYKTAPVVPAGADLPALEASPATVVEGEATEVTVTAPAGSFDDGEYVDIWSQGDDPTVLDTVQAAEDGSATLTFTLPATQPVGTATFLVRGDSDLDEELRTAEVEVTEAPVVQTTTTLTRSAASQVYGGDAPVTLSAAVEADDEVEGTVTFNEGTRVVASGVALEDGVATTTLPSTLDAGRHTFTATFVPSSDAAAGSTSEPLSVVVAKATTTTTATFTKRIRTTTQGVVTVKVTAPGATVSAGTATITVGSRTYVRSIIRGGATVTLPRLSAGTYTVKVSYAGSLNFRPSSSTPATLTVVK